MRLRLSYVSNSSSSSFLLSYTDGGLSLPGGDSVTFRDVLDMVRRRDGDTCSESTKVVASGRENCLSYLRASLSDWEPDRLASLEPSLSAPGRRFAVLRVSHSDDVTDRLAGMFVSAGELRMERI